MKPRRVLVALALAATAFPAPVRAADPVWVPTFVAGPVAGHPSAFGGGVGYLQGENVPGTSGVDGHGTVYRTADHGLTWTPLPIPAWVGDDVLFASPTTGYAHDSGRGMAVTRDGGATWTRLPNLPLGPSEALLPWLDRGFAASPDGRTLAMAGKVLDRDAPGCGRPQREVVLWSADGGVTWRTFTFPLGPTNADPLHFVVGIAVHDARHGAIVTRPWAGCEDGGLLGPTSVWTTADAGRTWRRVLRSGKVAPSVAAYAGDGTLVVGDENGTVLRSADGVHFATAGVLDGRNAAADLSPLYVDETQNLVCDVRFAGTTGYLVQRNGAVWRSGDAGRTWTHETTLDYQSLANDPRVGVFDAGHAYVVQELVRTIYARVG